MNSSPHSHVTDELLSAYLDNALPPAERAMIEEAVARDDDVAWRLQTLRYTVELMQQLPEIPLPRQFTLSEAQLQQMSPETPGEIHHSPRVAPAGGSLWDRMADFVRSGNDVWRNAAAACATLLLVLLIGNSLAGVNEISRLSTDESSSIAARQRSADGAAAPAESAAPTILAAPGAPGQQADQRRPATGDGVDTESAAQPAPARAVLSRENESFRRGSPPPPPGAPEAEMAAAESAPRALTSAGAEEQAAADAGAGPDEAMQSTAMEETAGEPTALAAADSVTAATAGATAADDATVAELPVAADAAADDVPANDTGPSAAETGDAPQSIALASAAESAEPAPQTADSVEEVQPASPPARVAPASGAAGTTAETSPKQPEEKVMETAAMPPSTTAAGTGEADAADGGPVSNVSDVGTADAGTTDGGAAAGAETAVDPNAGGSDDTAVAMAPTFGQDESRPSAGATGAVDEQAPRWLLYAQILLALLLVVFLLLWRISARSAASS